METWIDAFNLPKYEVSNEGNVRRKKNGKILKSSPSDRGYRCIDAWLDSETKKRTRIGKLVWESFNNCECKLTIDHRDRNKLNDSLENLSCITNKENAKNRDQGRMENKYKLDDKKKQLIITNIKNKTWTIYKVWRIFGIPSNYMSSVVKRGSWEHLCKKGDIDNIKN